MEDGQSAWAFELFPERDRSNGRDLPSLRSVRPIGDCGAESANHAENSLFRQRSNDMVELRPIQEEDA